MFACKSNKINIFTEKHFQTIDEGNLVKRDTTARNAREELHLRVLKFLTGRYKSVPFLEKIEADKQGITAIGMEGSTTMEPYIKVTTTLSPDELNTKVFGGYFTSILGNSLAYYFNVTSKIYSTPPFVMIHYYFPGDFIPPDGAFIGKSNLTECADVVHFCPTNSKQLCLKNGTIYCVAPTRSTLLRPVDGMVRSCVQTKVKVNCKKHGLIRCEKMIPLHIPCYAMVTLVEGDEGARWKIYKEKYCILIVAYPLPKLSNSEFIEYLRDDEEGQRIVTYQFNSLADTVLQQLFQ